MLSDLAILEKPIGIRSEHTCIEPTTLRLKQHSSLTGSGGYTITDASGTYVRFSADGKTKKWYSTRAINDAAGLPLYELRCDRWVRWTICMPGAGDEEDDAAARFNRRRSPNGDTLVIRFLNAETSKEVTLAVRGKTTLVKAGEQCASSKDASVYLDDRLVMQTNILDGKTARLPFKTNEWEISIAQGFDESLAVTIAVYLAIYLCEKPVVTKSEVFAGIIAPAGVAGVAGGGVAVGGGGGDGGGGEREIELSQSFSPTSIVSYPSLSSMHMSRDRDAHLILQTYGTPEGRNNRVEVTYSSTVCYSYSTHNPTVFPFSRGLESCLRVSHP
ncbi:hypothetical protein Q7P37_007883 [Cladosporium fusiforme]